MNNDPGAAGEGGRDHATKTLSGKSHRQPFLDISGSSFTEQWRRGVWEGAVLRRSLGRADECLQKAS